MKGNRGAFQKNVYIKDKYRSKTWQVICERYRGDCSEGVYLHGKEKQVKKQERT